MTKEDLKSQAAALIEAAYALGIEAGKATAPADKPESPSQPSLAAEITPNKPHP